MAKDAQTRVDSVDRRVHTMGMTQTALPTKPLNREPLCIGSACEYEWRAPDPARLIRFGGWRLTHVDPECTAHGHMTRVNVAALLRFGD